MKRGTVLALVVILSILPLASHIPTASAQGDTAWVGEYYNNPTLSGTPVLVRADADIDFVWGMGAPAPGLPADRFSVRWTKGQFFSGGTYRVTARSDDGIRVYVDNTLVVDAWYDRAPDPPIVAEINITQGEHALRVEYYENTGASLVSVTWEPVSSLVTATWVAEYYNNPNLAGPAAFEQTEAVIDYNWGYNSPFPGLIPPDNFSVRWTGSPNFSAGTYTFTVYADDGVRMWVDDRLVIDAWYDSGFTPPYTAVVALGQGQHAIRIEYYEHLEIAAIRVEWAQVSAAPPTPVPSTTTITGAWLAEYFNNTALSGLPVYQERIEGLGFDLNWRTGSPAAVVPADNFSARLTRSLTFDAGPVRFAVRADDGVRMYIDGVLVLDEWHLSSGDYFFLDREMTPGEHTIVLEYYEATRLASLRFYWVYTRPAVDTTINVQAQVNAFLLNVRQGPGVAYPVIGRVHQNTMLPVTGRSSTDPRWLRVNYGAVQGWVSGSWTTLVGDAALIPVVPPAEEVAPLGFGTPTGLRIRTTANLNVRSGPGITYTRIGWLANGTVADVVGRNADNTWWEVNFPLGRGWVSAAYTQLEGDLSAEVPVTG